MPKYLTPEGLEKLKKELEYLKKVKRKEIAERLRKTSAMGDLTENAAYQETKEAQAFLEGQIFELEKEIGEAKIIDKIEKAGWVQIGSTVVLSSDHDKKREKFQIVGSAEANPSEGKISADSPLGKTLLDKPKGAIITVKTPKGKIKYKIIKIE